MLVVVFGSVAFFFLALPLVVVLSKLHAVWQVDRVVGIVLSVVVLLTGLLFAVYFVALGIIVFSGG